MPSTCGHSFSEKPEEGYYDQQNWTDDIHSIITTLKLRKTVLVGCWSYGGKVVLDYINVYGQRNISGINLVDVGISSGIAGGSYYTPASQAVIPGLKSNDVLESVNTLKQFVQLLFYQEPSVKNFYFILGYNTTVPPYVSEAIITRTVSHDELLPTIKVPVLLTHGLDDKILYPAQSISNSKIIPNSTLSLYKLVGHSPFWEDPTRFNRELTALTTGRN